MLIAVLITSVLAIPQQQVQQPQQQQQQSIYDIISSIVASSNELNTTKSIIDRVPAMKSLLQGQSSDLEGVPVNQTLTFFAPSNMAWQQLSQSVLQALNQTNQTLQSPFPRSVSQEQNVFEIIELLVAYHTVNQSVNLNQTQFRNQTLETLLVPIDAIVWQDPTPQPSPDQLQVNANAPSVNVQNQGFYYNDLNITAGWRASNGYIYIVDGVTSPLWFVNTTLENIGQDQDRRRIDVPPFDVPRFDIPQIPQLP